MKSSEKSAPEKFFTALSIGILGFSSIALVIAPIAFIAMLGMWYSRGFKWLAVEVFPEVSGISFIIAAFLVLGSLPFLIFRASRTLSGSLLFIASYALGLTVWLSALVDAYYYAGMLWLIVGLVFAGIGVVPIAFIALLLSGKFASASILLALVIVLFVLRVGGSALGLKEEEK